MQNKKPHMNEKLFYFTLLGAALVIGFAFGRVLTKVAQTMQGGP